MEILKYSIDTVKEFPLKQHFTINKGYEYIIGIITESNINTDILENIKEKSSQSVVYIGNALLEKTIISFFEIKNIVAIQPLLNSINRCLGNDGTLEVSYVPSLKELCIDVWGDIIYPNIIIDRVKIDVRCL